MNESSIFSKIEKSIIFGILTAIGINFIFAEKFLSDYEFLRIPYLIIINILILISIGLIFKLDLNVWGQTLKGFFLGFSIGSLTSASSSFVFIEYFRRIQIREIFGLSRSIFFMAVFAIFERVVNMRIVSEDIENK